MPKIGLFRKWGLGSRWEGTFSIFDSTKLTVQEQHLRTELIERLRGIEDPEILRSVMALLDRDEPPKDFWDELATDQQARVLNGLAELKEGKGVPAAQVLHASNSTVTTFPKIRLGLP